MGYRPCPNCNETNPRYRAACYRCNSPLTRDEEERRREQRIENELREANGKDPLPVEETDETVEPVQRNGDLFVFFAVVVLLVALVAYFVSVEFGLLPV